ncbi:MAG TPA: disulfide bond formation protein B [Burkholderiales bacterium]|nr:disulfide bond formation protein B [Burkholderiales bacterium]
MLARLCYLFVLLAAALLLGLGIYFQHALRLHSCTPQAVIRYMLVFAAMIALLAVAIGAGRLTRTVLSACIGVIALIGAAAAAHQSWPRQLPLNMAMVEPHVDPLIRALPLSDALPRYFLGSGECERAGWKLIGVAGSEWAFAAFLLFLVAVALAARRK